MALVESNYFEIGKIAPKFYLFDTLSDMKLSLDELKGKNGTLIAFICNHCPFVLHINQGLIKLANDFKNKGVNVIAISSNDIYDYPQDAPEFMKITAQNLNYPFPYLFDENQDVAKAYDAACTPDFYLFDEDLKALYHGQMDNSRPGNGIPVSGIDLRNAITLMLNKSENTSFQKPSIGCSIKWKNS
jgi:peroxiredoxin